MTESTVTARPDARTPTRAGLALAVVVSCQLMVVLDATVVNIALPSIQRDLHFSSTSLAWVLNAYTLAFGGLLLLGGRAGDILGRRRVLMAGIGLFTVASLLGGFATNGGWLLAARAAQGVGGAAASPSALALIATTFPEGPLRTRALGTYVAASAAGSGVGLLLGGMLTSWVSWRWVLFVNVPVGAFILLAAPRYVAESEPRPGRFDLRGALTSTAGMVALVYGFIRAASDGWGDTETTVAFGVAVVLLAGFLRTEMRAAQPIVPLRLFADRQRSTAYGIRVLLLGGMFGMFFFLTQFLQQVLGFSPIRTGVAFLPITVMLFAATRIATALLPRVGAKTITVAGLLITLAGMVWLSRISVHTGYAGGVVGPLLLLGAGMGLPFVSLTTLSLAGVEPGEAGAASGLLNVTQQVGGTLGLAVLVTVFGTVSRHASGSPREVLAHGIAGAFTASSVLEICALLLAVVALRHPAPAVSPPAVGR